MKILIIDNYDSFTYNLYQLAGEILEEAGRPFAVDVIRNDRITAAEIEQRRYDRIVISPGPGDPADKKYFGACAAVLTKIAKNKPVLGICLGMQGLAYYYGGKVVRAQLPMHGKTSMIRHDGTGVFAGLPQTFEAMRYHSLIVEPKSLPASLVVAATANGEIMGLRHKNFPLEGVQFHPESFATEFGKQLLSNFLSV